MRRRCMLKERNGVCSSRLIGSRYYAASLILGTVALAYGSVPLYKMVRQACP